MRICVPMVTLSLMACAGCGDRSSGEARAPEPSPGPGVVGANPSNTDNAEPAATSANAASETPVAIDERLLAGMTPGRRREFTLGFRDCLADRYAPDSHSEAYRLGCAAAADLKGGAE